MYKRQLSLSLSLSLSHERTNERTKAVSFVFRSFAGTMNGAGSSGEVVDIYYEYSWCIGGDKDDESSSSKG